MLCAVLRAVAVLLVYLVLAVWYTTVHDANRVELIPSVNRGQPTAHTLPEPIAALCSHPDTSDLGPVLHGIEAGFDGVRPGGHLAEGQGRGEYLDEDGFHQ